MARIEAQARGDQNQKDLNIAQIFRMIVREQVGCRAARAQACMQDPGSMRMAACMHALQIPAVACAAGGQRAHGYMHACIAS